MKFMEKLLNGAVVEWHPLDSVAKIKHGKDWKGLNEGDVPVYGSGGIMGYVDTYSYNKPTVLIPRKGSITNIFYVDTPFWNVDTIYYTEIDTQVIVPKYFYYFVKTIDLLSLDTGSGRPSLTQSILNKIPVLIPCPENPKKSLEIQAEIVRILDAFTAMTAELTAELKLRNQQYQYFRDKLLTFDMSESSSSSDEIGRRIEVEWKMLAEMGELVRGNGLPKADFTESGVPAIHYGQIYTYYGLSTVKTKSFVSLETAKKLKKVDTGDVVITNTSENLEDVGKALVYLGKQQAVTGGHATIFKPNPYILGKYFAYYTQTTSFSEQKRRYAKGTKVIDVSATDMAKILIPVPPVGEQTRIVDILDKFDALTSSISEGLPREIELRQKQYEYYRDLLLSFPQSSAQVH